MAEPGVVARQQRALQPPFVSAPCSKHPLVPRLVHCAAIGSLATEGRASPPSCTTFTKPTCLRIGIMSNNVQQDCFTLQGLFGKLIYLFPDMRPNFQFENLVKGEDQNVGIKSAKVRHRRHGLCNTLPHTWSNADDKIVRLLILLLFAETVWNVDSTLSQQVRQEQAAILKTNRRTCRPSGTRQGRTFGLFFAPYFPETGKKARALLSPLYMTSDYVVFERSVRPQDGSIRRLRHKHATSQRRRAVEQPD